MSYSARAVASALLNRANRRRLLRSACVSMQRFDGAVPTTVPDSKWPNPRRESTRLGLSAMGTRIGIHGSADHSTFSRPSILLGVHPLLSASMTRESGGGYAMRVGLRGRRARCSAFLRAAMAEWNGLDVPTRPSSSGAAVRDDTSRSRWTRTTGRVSARD